MNGNDSAPYCISVMQTIVNIDFGVHYPAQPILVIKSGVMRTDYSLFLDRQFPVFTYVTLQLFSSSYGYNKAYDPCQISRK